MKNNPIELNFEGSIKNDEVKNTLHIPVVSRKNKVNQESRLDDESPSRLETTVKVKDLYIDMQYQREPNVNKVSKIARNFNPDALGVIICSLREDGKVAVIDGGHRVAALNLMGMTDLCVKALVYIDLTIEEEAKIFTLMNDNRTKPKTADLFKAEVIANDSKSLGLHNLMTSLGLVASNAPGNNKIRCIGTLKEVYNGAGFYHTKLALESLKTSFGDHSSSFNADAITAIAIISKRYGDKIDKKLLIKSLQRFENIDALINKAKSIMSISKTSMKYSTLPFIIVESYNFKLKSNRINTFDMTVHPTVIWE
jgi:hypothetical protein